MNQFVIPANQWLKKDTSAFFHVPYTRMGNPGNPDYVNVLKNTYNTFPRAKLTGAMQELYAVLLEDFPKILETSGLGAMTVCVVPRAKAESFYHANQVLFRATVQLAVKNLNGFQDGTHYMQRRKNTRTTHLRNPIPNYNNDGLDPFPGITLETCEIASGVVAKDILLVDDIYTRNVNVDEDAIQALLDAKAKSVIFYAIGRA